METGIRKLNKWQSAVMTVGAVLLVVGAVMYVLMLFRGVASWLTLVGALAFGAMQCLQTYKGTSITMHRLRTIQIIAALMIVLAALMMIQDTFMLLPLPWQYQVQWVHNNWVVAMLAGALLEFYTTLRMQHELEKEAKKT